MEGNCHSYIDLMPLEIILEILSYLHIRDILISFRLVSNKFEEIATDFCNRGGRVTVCLPRILGIPDVSIGQRFSSDTPLPFSSAEISFIPDDEVGLAFSQEVSCLCGNRLRSLKVTVEHQELRTLLSYLRHYPNIMSLKIVVCEDEDDSPFDKNSTFSENSFKELKLKKLKILKLEVRVMSEIFNTLQMLIDSSDQIEVFDLRFCLNNLTDLDFAKIIDHVRLRNFHKLTLGLPYESSLVSWKKLVDQGPLRIQKLTIYLFVVEGIGNFDLLSRFLGNCRGLTSLTLTDFHLPRDWFAGIAMPQFQIPEMADLTKLKFQVLPREYPLQQISVVQFVPVGAQMFPKLTAVSIGPWLSSGVVNFDPNDLFPVRDVQGFSVNGHGCFGQVKTLKLGYGKSKGSWSKVFPNVSQLKATITEAGQLPVMLEGMLQLTDLEIMLDQDVEHVHSIMHEFVGIQLSLKKTQTVTIRSYVPLDDRVVLLLALLPPMRLTVYHTQLSAFCISVLRNRHHMFLFTTDCQEI